MRTRLAPTRYREDGINRYLVAIVAVTAALGVRWALTTILGETAHSFVVLFTGAAMASAWLGGFRAGMFATLLSTILLGYFFFEPGYSLRIERADDLALLLSHIAISVAASWVCEDLRGARRRAAEAIAEQRQAYDDAKTWRLRYEAAVASSRSILYDRDLQTRRATFGGAVSAILGFALGEMPDDHDGYDALIHPEDRETFRIASRNWERTGEPFSLEYRLRRSDGGYAAVQDDGQVLANGDGRPGRIVGLLKDMTDHKRAEQALERSELEYRSLFEGAEIGNTEIDLNTKRFIRVNRRYCEMTGYESGELLSGVTPLDITHPDDRDRNDAAIARMRDEGEGFEIEKRYIRKNGRIIWVHVSSTLIRDAEGKPARSVGSVIDISARKEAEERLREADRRKDEFLATLAHELRNPLAPIRNSVEIIKMSGHLPASISRSLEMMDRQLGHLVHLIDDLLDVSRITRGKLRLRVKRVDLSEIVDAAVEACMPLIARREHELSVAPVPRIQLVGDLTRLVQILSNLLTNAAKYTEPGGRIALSARRQGDDIVLLVKDNGIGIPPELHGKVFDIFSQVDRTLEKTGGGLGIGLSLVKGLAEMHGGAVKVRSEGEGQGSEFEVRLPIEPRELELEPARIEGAISKTA